MFAVIVYLDNEKITDTRHLNFYCRFQLHPEQLASYKRLTDLPSYHAVQGRRAQVALIHTMGWGGAERTNNKKSLKSTDSDSVS